MVCCSLLGRLCGSHGVLYTVRFTSFLAGKAHVSAQEQVDYEWTEAGLDSMSESGSDTTEYDDLPHRYLHDTPSGTSAADGCHMSLQVPCQQLQVLLHEQLLRLPHLHAHTLLPPSLFTLTLHLHTPHSLSPSSTFTTLTSYAR